MFFRLFKAKCPNCGVRGPWDDVVWEGSGWKFFYPTWPCKACGIIAQVLYILSAIPAKFLIQDGDLRYANEHKKHLYLP